MNQVSSKQKLFSNHTYMYIHIGYWLIDLIFEISVLVLLSRYLRYIYYIVVTLNQVILKIPGILVVIMLIRCYV